MSSASDTAHHWPALAYAPRQIGFPLLRHPGDTSVGSTSTVTTEAAEPTAAEQAALAAATEAGHAAGLERGRAAAKAETTQRLQALDQQLEQARTQLRAWTDALETAFSERCHAALTAIVGERLKVSDSFFHDLLREAAADLRSDVESLQLVVASDLADTVPDGLSVAVDVDLEPGEIRILSHARVAQLRIAEQVTAALRDLPQLDEVEVSQASEPDVDAE